ncbi:MAG: gluconate 2-dehydrogenase subunit 3 family protein [Caldilineaceae bacterium]
MPPQNTLIALNPIEARTADALFERLFPADAETAGASAIGVVDYVDRSLGGAYADQRAAYRRALAGLDAAARAQFRAAFADCAVDAQDQLVAQLAKGSCPVWRRRCRSHFSKWCGRICRKGSSPTPFMAATGTSWAGAYWGIPACGWKIAPPKI